MTQDLALLLMLALAGLAGAGWLRRAAPAAPETWAKWWVGSGAAAAAVVATLAGSPPSAPVRALAMLAALGGVAGPLLLAALGRAGAWRAADAWATLLYWTPGGRDAARALLARAALQRGDADAALARLPASGGAALAVEAHALRGAWAEAVERPLPTGAAGRDARVAALLALGRRSEAAGEVAELAAAVRAGRAGPVAYRAWFLADLRLRAEDGDLVGVRDALRSPPAGVPQETYLASLARAAEVAGEAEIALRVHAEAFRVAAPGRRAPHERALRAAGRPLPAPARAAGRAPATWTLAGVIALAYLGQVVLDRVVGALPLAGASVEASAVAAAFVVGVPSFPAADAAWRYLSYAFVHGNLIHVGFNLWVLLDLGRIVETRRGPGYLLAAFAVGTAMGAFLTASAQAGPVLLVGASGGVLGAAGALLADVSRRRTAGDRALLRGLLQWMVLIALLSLAIPNVSWWGHVGGVVGGALWGFARQGLPDERRIDLLAGGAAVAALAWGLGQALRVAALLG